MVRLGKAPQPLEQNQALPRKKKKATLIAGKYELRETEANVRFNQLKTSKEGFSRIFAASGSRAVLCASPLRFIAMTASGCLCLELRAAPFMCRLIAGQLALVISLRFVARALYCGHGLDYRRRQSHRRSGKLEQLNNQVHGRITSFPRRRRCQHTGLSSPVCFGGAWFCISRIWQKRVLQ